VSWTSLSTVVMQHNEDGCQGAFNGQTRQVELREV